MKKILSKFSFWGLIIALLIIAQQQTGYDSKSIILINFNPLLNSMVSHDKLMAFMNSGYQLPCRNLLAGTISIYWYFGAVISWMFYGGIIDLIRYISSLVIL